MKTNQVRNTIGPPVRIKGRDVRGHSRYDRDRVARAPMAAPDGGSDSFEWGCGKRYRSRSFAELTLYW